MNEEQLQHNAYTTLSQLGMLFNRLEAKLQETERELKVANEKLKKKYIPISVLEEWLFENGWEKYDNLQRTIFAIFPSTHCSTGYAFKIPNWLGINGNCLSYDNGLFSTIASYSGRDLDALMMELDVKILNNEMNNEK